MPIGFIGIARDITGQVQAQSALKKSEEMLAVITENMSDMIRVMDFNGVNMYAIPSHKKSLAIILTNGWGNRRWMSFILMTWKESF